MNNIPIATRCRLAQIAALNPHNYPRTRRNSAGDIAWIAVLVLIAGMILGASIVGSQL